MHHDDNTYKSEKQEYIPAQKQEKARKKKITEHKG